ncbi:MAG: Glu/Leu/Phe/Val dehydrogenase dimerization domain-containing protein [Nitrospirota bacterium]|nr:Glu/Leu/Phe/Val dehydrogenase dimerization domain-containing protein [Nitrospirota bacterium]
MPARIMTMKNSIAGLPHGGGKAGIIANHKDPKKSCISETLLNKLNIYLNISRGMIWRVMR